MLKNLKRIMFFVFIFCQFSLHAGHFGTFSSELSNNLTTFASSHYKLLAGLGSSACLLTSFYIVQKLNNVRKARSVDNYFSDWFEKCEKNLPKMTPDTVDQSESKEHEKFKRKDDQKRGAKRSANQPVGENPTRRRVSHQAGTELHV